jgi:4-carboxymuconolactone decarboxylase
MSTGDLNREQLRERGQKVRARAQGEKHETLQGILNGYDRGMGGYVDEFIFGQVWARPGLTFEERMIVAITALAATEHPNQLRNYLHGALQDGIPASKIHEIVVMLAVYCGFPTALEAMTEWQSVLRSVRKQGMALDIDQELEPTEG